ncbi:hypothetical protein SAMN04488120_101255 [Fontimonas thermophila]|uniref:Probable membrane transporter protein n=1 Tax=Fontimonas thermophila TaxID=1076937 RepID=A0A1I2HAG0_9GAMM|nr:sulfite exporter TauE/SafE family protein [Fontimonas thermophila]SFF26290.1 hypothetical protein SAMN04488120_101255 [Fontimonas thermophila]
MTLVLTGALGTLVGVVLGLTGAGGAILAVPLLMWGLGWSLAQAAPVALVAVTAAALAGTLAAWPARIVRWRAALLLAGAGAASAPLGLHAAAALPDLWLRRAFAVVLLVAAARMLHQATRTAEQAFEHLPAPVPGADDSGRAICRISAATGRILWTIPCMAVIALTGALTGLLSGLLGVGGGFIIVPVLRAVTTLSMHAAIATALMAVALTGSAAVASAIAHDLHLPWAVALPFVGGALAGMFAGRRIAPRIPGSWLQRGFALLLIGVAGALALQAGL